MKLVLWLLVAVTLVYAFYSGAMAVWSYFEIYGLVEQVVPETAQADRDRAQHMRAAILRRAADSGIAVNERETTVVDEGRAVAVGVRWAWPVIVYRGEVVLAIPLKHERVFAVPERR